MKDDADSGLDDLFGEPAADEAPATPAPVGDDPFGTMISREPVELIVRTWRDNTGLYEVEGQLTSILGGKVRLTKTNGRTCTVDFRRLSTSDMEYVQQVAAAMGQNVVDQLASR